MSDFGLSVSWRYFSSMIISCLDLCNSLLTCFPSSLFPAASTLNMVADGVVLWKPRSMSLLCSKPCNDFLSHSEEKPKSLPVSTMPSHLVPALSVPHFLLLPLAHPMPHTSLLFHENTRHSHTLRLQSDCSLCLEYFNSRMCVVHSHSPFMSLFKCHPLSLAYDDNPT